MVSRIILINDREYILDWEAKLYRSQDNPADRITFEEYEKLIISRLVQSRTKGHSSVRIT